MSFLSPIFGGNLKVLLLSFVVATTFWFFNALNKEDYNVILRYPIQFQFDQEEVVVTKPLPRFVGIDVAGGGWNLFRRTFKLFAKPILITLDNPTEVKYISRSTLIPVISEQFPTLKIRRIITDTLLLSIEKKIIKEVKLFVKPSSLMLKENYRVAGPIKIEPATVTLSGPEKLMANIDELIELEIFRTGISRDFDRDVEVVLPIDHVTSSPEEVNVQFGVNEYEIDTRTIRVDLIGSRTDSDQNFSLLDSMVTVSYEVDKDYADKIESKDFMLAIDVDAINDSSTTAIPYFIHTPKNIMSPMMEPDTLRIIHR